MAKPENPGSKPKVETVPVPVGDKGETVAMPKQFLVDKIARLQRRKAIQERRLNLMQGDLASTERVLESHRKAATDAGMAID